MFRLYLQDIDHKLFRFFNQYAGMSSFSDRIFVISAEFIIFIMIAGLAFFVISKNTRERQTGILQALVAGFFGRVVFDSLVYMFFFRARPFVSAIVNQLVYHNPLEPSFPSGHASVMFAMAFSLFFTNKKWGTLYLVLALISSVSRVVVGIHYPFDVVAGLFMGVLSAFAAKWLFDFWFSEKLRKAK